MSKKLVCLALIGLAAMPGCGSVLFSPYQEVPFECVNVPTAGFSAPAQGAGCRSGQNMRLDRRRDYMIEVKAKGYETQTLQVESKVSVLRAAVSIILNGLISTPTLWIATPFLCAIDIKAGAWQVLEPGEVAVELYRPGQGPPPVAISGRGDDRPSIGGRSSYCSSCGAGLSPRSSFCGSCGTRAR